jgi:DNA-binding transcriptional MerR regulator
MSITDLSIALGVRSSTLRFWEDQGLIAPERVDGSGRRRYPPDAVRDARIVAALREGGYRIPAVREVMASVRGSGGGTDARAALQDRLQSITARSESLLRAGAGLVDLLDAVDRHRTAPPPPPPAPPRA